MIKLTEHIIKSFVTHPDSVEVSQQTNPDGSLDLSISLHPEDIPLVIGKQGKNIKAIRCLVRLKGALTGVRVRLNLEEPPAA